MTPRCIRKLIVTLLLAAWLPATQAQLPEPVAGMLRAANIPEEALGVVVLRLPDAAPVLIHHAERSFQPGSTMKLLTTLVALDKLGPTYRGRTELVTNGKIEGDTLHGDLVVRGLGDVDLGWESFQEMLQKLRNRGVTVIDGDLLLDRHFFNPPRTDVGVPPFDEAPEFEYNVIPDALSLNNNLLRFELESDDRQVRVHMSPILDRVSVSTDMTLNNRECKDWDDDWLPPDYSTDAEGWIHIKLHGKFPRNCAKAPLINVLDRVVLADRLFRSIWKRLAGKFLGITRDAPTPPGAQLLADHESRPLLVVVRDINKKSDNAFSRVTYLTLGATDVKPRDGDTVTAVRSEKVVRAWLKDHGIDDQGLVLENGSGLSRLERIRPAQLAAILLTASRNVMAPEFLASMSIAGVDGTMRLRLKESPAAGRARIKDGTLNGVLAVAGYVPDAGNRMHIVVGFLNHESASNATGRAILDALIDWVARSGAAPAAN